MNWCLKRRDGQYLAGISRDGVIIVADAQHNAVRWTEEHIARWFGAITGCKPVRLRPRPSTESPAVAEEKT